MIFQLSTASGQPVYLQLVQQVLHAVETGVLLPGDQLPGIRTLAQELVVSHNTIARAYFELEHEGAIELRQGSGAYVSSKRRSRSRAEKLRQAGDRVRAFLESLAADGLTVEEIHRIVEAELFYQPTEEEP